jgi:thioredoxin-like negative regulator of GroEL
MNRRFGPALRPLALLFLTHLSACDSGEPPQEVAVVATKSDAEVPTWLSPTDAMEPALWLARREPGQAAKAAARSDHLRHSLARARQTFIEDPRMIANRTVQLGQMLAEAGKPESYESLLDGLEAAAAPTRRKQLYGELCQHYYNTRQQGLDRTRALARLTERYAAQPVVPDATP